MYKNMRKRSNILLHSVVHAVDQGNDAHQQEQPLPELQKQEWRVLHAFRNIHVNVKCVEVYYVHWVSQVQCLCSVCEQHAVYINEHLC